MRCKLSRSTLHRTACLSCRREILRAYSTRCTTIRNAAHAQLNGASVAQKRHITQQHLRRTAEAEEQWKLQAKEIEAGRKQSFLSFLEERGLVNSVVGQRDALDKLITRKRVGFYAGVDPTAPSLHIGHMLPFMILGWAYVHGLKAVFLIGGSTAKIGDPTGRLEGRPLMDGATRRANIANIHLQLKRLGFSFEKYGRKHGFEWEWAWRRALENNNTWWNKQSLKEVMEVLGTSLRLGPMLGRDYVKSRLASGEGMSIAEFCYPIMQGWDFWYLFQRKVQVQVGGSDQYGNILFGMDAIKGILKANPESEWAPKKDEDPDLANPYGITTPLLTTASGEKIGKSAGNAVWLDKDMTSCYDLYQYFVRVADSDVERYLKMFTFVPTPAIKELMEEHAKDPSKRVAQHKLAREFVELIHGSLSAEKAAKDHRTLFMTKASAGAPEGLAAETEHAETDNAEGKHQKLHAFETATPHIILPRSLVINQFFHKVLWSAGMVSSKSEGFRLIVNNGVHVASRSDSREVMGDGVSYIPVKTWPADITEKFVIDGRLLILRIGKWNLKIIKIVPDSEYAKMGLNAPGWEEHESPEERANDKKLFTGRKIKGRRVKLPAFAQTPKPEIKHWTPGNPIGVLPKDGDE
ncbi:tyrosine-tRNA ligase [Coccidioides immitis RS]|uniref:Tyrosine--tRNA ligase n=4 Tax=Coccidioides immitis TaxID=5501 RepID=J3K6A2_COCIM|nr:tyrosine-tRNA ligase [Coccidioides immitis RS]EAS30078.3 tyrosine-tRNA ligase [Coccidioides immitis RS]KMP07024.1 tyrosyl-tRNA synthetase [Coccidioides immitis RMSCC 2394]KMU73334.1 tyrosyl-tRNA synthetase [Coccidioides immitis RMSCC 3703]TPX22149.1 tyrosyl-tRNA synthetase [Coccidioides immitis]